MKQDVRLTIIGIDMDIDGSLVSDSDIRIDGRFHGELMTSGRIVVSQDGFLNGTIKGKDITIHGKAKGDFEALNNFQIAPGGAFEGFVNTRFMNITEAVYFDGACVINPEKGSGKFCNEISNLSYLKKRAEMIRQDDKMIPEHPAKDENTEKRGADIEKGSGFLLNNTISKIKSL